MKITSILIKFSKLILTNNTKDQRLNKISQDREWGWWTCEDVQEPSEICAAQRELMCKVYTLLALLEPYFLLIISQPLSLSFSLSLSLFSSLISFCQFLFLLTLRPNLIGRDKQIFARHSHLFVPPSTLSLINFFLFNYFFLKGGQK